MKKSTNDLDHEGMKEIFCRFIVRNGVRIYPKKGKFFHFWVKEQK